VSSVISFCKNKKDVTSTTNAKENFGYFYNMTFTKTTEQDSNYNHLEKMTITELLTNINSEDKTVPLAVEKAISQIENVIEQVVIKLKTGGRLF
jgi:N-acetylmuramic acid 6-phosphate etherase